LLSLGLLLPASAADWPGFLGPAGDGTSPETGLDLRWGEQGPPVAWQVEAGEGYATASVAGGVLYFFDRRDGRARLTAEDMYGFSNGPRAVPVVDDGRVFTFGPEGRLRAHAVADGSLLWEVDTTRRFGVVQNFFGAGSTPVVEDGLLILPVGGSPPDSPKISSGEVRPAGSAIVAFDKKSGEVRYRTGDELASYSSPRIVDVGGRRVGLAFMRGGLLGFDPRGGKVAFHFPWRARKLESVNAANPVVAGDRVLITESYGPGAALLRLRPDGVDVVWRDGRREQSLASHWMTPIAIDGVVYGCHGSGGAEARLRAVELATGKVLWSEGGFGRFQLIHADRHLIMLTEEVADARPRAAGGQPLIKAPAWNVPVLSNGRLFVRGKDSLVAFDLRSEEQDAAPQPEREQGEQRRGADQRER
jgi:outer membrane protein assembly factor BamB